MVGDYIDQLKQSLTFDPGLVRLRLACRALLTTVAVCSVLALLHRWLPMSAAAYAIGMITALQGAVAIKDTTIRARAVTRLYAAISAFAAIAAISLVETSQLLVSVLLLAIIFLAVYARRFGTRWQGVGMFTFMCAVVGAYLKAPAADLRDIALSLALSGSIAHLIRNFILPERPLDDFHRTLRVVRSLVAELDKFIRRNAVSGWTSASRNYAIAMQRRARDALLLCEGYLPSDADGAFADKRSAVLAMRLFDLNLALETTLATALASNQTQARAVPPILAERLDALKRAVDNAQAAAAGVPAGLFGDAALAGGKHVGLLPGAGQLFQDKMFRQAVQVTIASAIAMTGGLLLSPERWFWAVLTAFLVFSNTLSRGDIAVRGLNRTLGTAAGVCLGIGIATWLDGAFYATIALVAVSIFLAFYMSAISYSALTFFITIGISLVYGLVGQFTPELLVLRLEETAIGVAAGIFVSVLVLPTSTLDQTRQAMDAFLQALDGLIAAILDGQGEESAPRLLACSRQLDKAQADVSAAASPLQSMWSYGKAKDGPRRAMLRVTALVHAAHRIARHFSHAAPLESEVDLLRAIRAQLADLQANGRNMAGASRVTEMGQIPPDDAKSVRSSGVDDALHTISQILRQADPRNQET